MSLLQLDFNPATRIKRIFFVDRSRQSTAGVTAWVKFFSKVMYLNTKEQPLAPDSA
jgi:hypothetical protein